MTISVVRVASVNGSVEAEVLRGLLEAQGIEATLSHEAAGTSFGLSVGPLGRVDILVKQTDEQASACSDRRVPARRDRRGLVRRRGR